MEGLKSKYRVIALDLRGHGRSSMTLADQAVPVYARDLRAFIQKLKLENFVGVGWSMGAFVWWDYYLQFGIAGLKGLVNIDQAAERLALVGYSSRPSSRSRCCASGISGCRPIETRSLREVIPMMFAQPPAAADMTWMVDEMTRAPAVIAAAEMIDQSLREYQNMLFGYPVPTLACSGAMSAQPREGMQMIVDRVLNGQLQIFENCGHCLFLEDATGVQPQPR